MPWKVCKGQAESGSHPLHPYSTAKLSYMATTNTKETGKCILLLCSGGGGNRFGGQSAVSSENP